MMFLRVFRQDLKRAIFSKAFLFSVLGLVVVFGISSFPEVMRMKENGSSQTVAQIFELIFDGSMLEVLGMGLLALFPYAAQYAVDVEERAVPFWIIRCGVRVYSISKYVVGILSSMAAIMLALLLYGAALLPFVSLTPVEITFFSGNANSSLWESGNFFLYYVFVFLEHGIQTAFYAGLCGLTAALIPNRLAALSAPTVFYLLVLMWLSYLNIPSPWKLNFWVAWSVPVGSPELTLLLRFLVIGGLCAAMGAGTAALVKRRVLND